MNYLITGAAGYVGSRLTDLFLSRGETVYAAARNDFDYSEIGPIREYFRGKDIDRVVHLAGAIENKAAGDYYQSNISGLYYLLRVCAENRVTHITFASGNNVYPTRSEQLHKEDEFGQPEPDNLYGISKYAGELIVRDFCTGSSIGYANVRIGDIYGPNQKYGNLLKSIVSSVRSGTPLKLYGQGIRTRDYIYITDVVDGLTTISCKELSGTYNLGTGQGTSVCQLVEIANELSGGICGIENVACVAEDTSCMILDVSKLEKAGFSTKVDIRDGMKKTIGV